MLQKFVEECLLWVECHTGTGEESKEIEMAETMGDKLAAAPIPGLPVTLGGGRVVKNLRVRLSPERREGWVEGLRFGFIS